MISALPTPLIKLEKWSGSAWVNLKFTGTITNENVITIDNSSLVLLGEMKTDTKYRVSFDTPVLEGKDSHTDLDAYSKEFWTTDATAPTAPVIAFKTGSEVNDVSYNTTDGHVINLNIKATDVNSGLTDHTAIKVYYLKTAVDGALSAADVKGLTEGTGDEDFDLTYKGNMASKTSYYVYAVAEDVAGNLSAVSKLTVITDDVIKPALAAALPTTFNAAKTITIVFNEPVKPIVGAKARVIDNATGIVYLMDMVNLSTGTDANLKAISIVGGPFTQMLLDVHSYTIEIDPGMIVDVPRQVASADVNAPNAWDGIVGTSFQVTSIDQVKPVLVSTTPDWDTSSTDVDLNPTFTLSFSEPVKLNNTFTQYVIYEDLGTTLKVKSAAITAPVDAPYDILTAANVTGQNSSSIVLTTNRALVTGHSYYLVVKDLTYSDLSGNVWDNDGDVTINVTAKDVIGLVPSFKANATNLPAAAALSFVPNTLTINLGEAFFLSSALDPSINTFDLQSHVYLNQAGTSVKFSAVQVGNTIVLSGLNGSGLGDAAKGKTFTFGFVSLYDVHGFMNAGAEASFSVASDAVVDREVTFIPGDNDGDSDTKVNITVDQTFKVEFNGLLYTYNEYYPLNNLLMTKAYLQDNHVFTMNGATIKVVSLDLVGGKHVVTLQATAALASETTYTLNINSSWLDDDDNDAGIQIGQGTTPIDDYSETFVTADVQAPKLIADEDGVTYSYAYKPVKVGVVGKGQMLALEFDEEVKGAGSVEIHRWDGVLVATVDITGATSIDDEGEGWILNIGKPEDIMATNPTFVTNLDYYIVVPSGSVIDMAAVPNTFAGIVTVNEWKISLMDDTTPQVTFIDNTKNGLAVDTKVKLTFDRPVDLGKGWLALYYEDGKAVDLVRTSADNVAKTSYDFVLNRELAPNTKFLVELGGGTFELSANNSIKQEQKSIGEWYFSTEVNSVPVAETYVPAKADPMTSGVALTSGLSITFDQDIMAGTGNIQLHRKQNVGGPIITNFDVTDPTKVSFVGNTLSIAGDVLNLQNNSEYYVIIPATAVKNTSSTPEYWGGILVPFVWQFSTVNDQVAPTAVYAPNGALAIGLHPAEVKLTMTFSEAVVAGTGNLVIYNAADNTVVETVAITQSMFAGQVVTVAPTMLKEGTSYYVQVSAGAVKDLGGNSFAGISDKTSWILATGDFTVPELVKWTPNKETITGNHPILLMTFKEDVVLGAGNVKVFKVGTTTPVLNLPVTAAMVSGKNVTITYPSNSASVGGLDKNTDYYVTVDAGAVKDIAGNAFAGVADITAWTFKTGADFSTVIEPNVSLEFKVYPNPFVDYVNVDNASQLSKVIVTNIAGQTVKEVVNPTQRLQLNELRSGVYFISLYNMDNVIAKTAKIVKR
jgi:methionine-rich copper-binding protein CopC